MQLHRLYFFEHQQYFDESIRVRSRISPKERNELSGKTPSKLKLALVKINREPTTGGVSISWPTD